MNNHKGFKTLIVTLLLAIAGLFGYQQVGQQNFGVGGDSSFNRIENLTSVATTTGSYCTTCPVKLLDMNVNRKLAVIQNNSNAAVFLYATTSVLDLSGTGLPRYATGTITVLNGIRLAASGTVGDQITFGPDNMLFGHIWASSTAASKEIIVNYK